MATVGSMIRTGSIGVDIALGGGWRPGFMYEIWGDTGSGKTVLAMSAIEGVVRANHSVLWIDLNDGVRHMDNMPGMIVGRPRCAEEAFVLAKEACWWQGIDLVVVDPAQCLVRQRELDGDPDYVPHPQREYKNELSDLKDAARAGSTVVLFVSQPRDKERQPIRGTGISEKVLGRVHLHPDVIHQDGSREVQVHVKDSRRTQYDVARFIVRPGKGIDRARELVDEGVNCGCVIKRGTWYAWNNLQEQGAEAFARALTPHQLDVLDNEIRIAAGIV